MRHQRILGASLSAALLPGLLLLAPPANARAAFDVTASISKREVDLGQSVAINGKVSPGSGGELVVLQRKAGRKWKRVAAKRLNRNSAYRFLTAPPKAGTSTYRVVKPRGSTTRGVSPARSVKAYRWVYMDTVDWVDDWFVDAEPVTINGKTYAHGSRPRIEPRATWN